MATLFCSTTGASEDDIPSLEFFEYLGSLVEQEDGVWVGPEDMDSPVFESDSQPSNDAVSVPVVSNEAGQEVTR